MWNRNYFSLISFTFICDALIGILMWASFKSSNLGYIWVVVCTCHRLSVHAISHVFIISCISRHICFSSNRVSRSFSNLLFNTHQVDFGEWEMLLIILNWLVIKVFDDAWLIDWHTQLVKVRIDTVETYFKVVKIKITHEDVDKVQLLEDI